MKFTLEQFEARNNKMKELEKKAEAVFARVEKVGGQLLKDW
jgi:predicted transcriptional regulator